MPILAASLLLVSARAQAALNPAKAISQYTQDTWGTSSGLPSNSILAIAQTPDGYLWLGTEEGLARFDGVRFVIFDTNNTPALESNHVSALLVDAQNNLWIGTQGGGLTVFRNGQFTTYTTRNGLSNDTILALYGDGKGSLWIGTNGGGLNRFRNGKFETYTSRNGLPDDAVFTLAGGKDQSLWIGTHAGLVRFKNGAFTTYTTKDGLSDNYIKCLHVSHTGDVWVGTNAGGLSRFADGHFTNYSIRQGLSSNTIWCISEDEAGTLWVGTIDAGLNRFHGGKFTTYAAKDGLSSNRVFALLEDREGSLWIGTGGAGLARLKDGSFTTITSHEGLSSDVVLPVYEDNGNVIWVGTNGGGLDRIENGHITTYTTRDGLSDNTVFSLSDDKDHSLWIATHKGLDQLRNGRFRFFGTKSGLPNDIVVCLYRDRGGNLWAGSRGGLSRFDGARFKTYTTKDGLSSDYVVSIYQDSDGTLWIGTGGGGLNEFRNGHFSSYTTKNGLSSNAVWTLTGDAAGTLWIGTGGGGLDRLQNGKFTSYTVHQGLFDDEIFQILPDKYGYLWMSSNKGVFRVSKSQLTAYAEGHLTSITSIPYGISDGLKSIECNGSFQPAGWRTKDGRLLFPTMKGLAVVDPAQLKTNPLPPPVLIEKVSIDGLDFAPGKAARAKPGEGGLEFTFTAPSLLSSAKIEFKYKLEGFDKGWVYAGQRRTAYYTNIPPGSYRFTVIACNPGGAWSAKGASVTLTLLPHFYQTYSFTLCCIAGFGALCFGVYGLRIRHLKANERQLVRLVDERTQALKEQVDAKERAHAELAEAQQSLIELSRLSGMAEVATGVLHNVGNVLNSVNVGATVISGKLRDARLDNLSAAANMLKEHTDDLAGFVKEDPKGQRVLPYLVNLAQHLQNERAQTLEELDSLTGHIDHIKEIVATQQDYAKASSLAEIVSIPKVIEQALKMVETTLNRHHVDVRLEMEDVPEVAMAKHKLIEILVNLIRNAKQAVIEHNGPVREVRICVKSQPADRIRIEVQDTGVGLSPENVTRIFAHGFTTKRDGHGFGLHAGALAARQMGGSLWAESRGVLLGATFILELPVSVSAACRK